MAAGITLQEVRLPTSFMGNPVERANVRQKVEQLLAELGLKPTTNGIPTSEDQERFVLFFIGPNNSYAVVSGYSDGLLTIDINERPGSSKSAFDVNQVENIGKSLEKTFNGKKLLCLPAIRRGDKVLRYFPASDGLFIEYDFDKCVFEADSPYQNIKIMHSTQFGNTLILDDDPNLAESDLVYTQAITGDGKEDYRDKTVLILGGGDGGILHELLKEKPKHITMVDIDSMVLEAARKHLRGICYDSLDELKGDNYEVITADCVPILENFVKEGKVFDFVINDLTAIPCTSEPAGDLWDFLRLILNFSMQVLAPCGKYYTQGNGFNNKDALGMYEKQLGKLPMSVGFKNSVVCVPSYQEMWVFYEIWKKGPQDTNSHNC